MTFLLEPDAYTSVHSLFEVMNYHLAVVTVLAGILPGKVYVDNPASPATAILIPSNQHRIYASGEPSPDLFADVIHLLFNESHAESYGFVVYYDTSHPWDLTLEQVLQKQETESLWRQFYRLTEPPSLVAVSLPAQITIARIDEGLIADTALGNRDLLCEEIQSESPSIEYFFHQNFGFCAQDDQRLVAWCLAEFHYQGRYELGIETIEAYRGRGIATHLAATVIRQAFAQGDREIGWHCWADNTPSVATALKVGFEKALDYPAWYVHYRKIEG